MENVWFHPDGYQKTSKKLQLECLKTLLNFSDIKGNILDVGCGTGNTLNIINIDNISSYTGIDVSPEMIDFAQSHHEDKKIKFIVNDFLLDEQVASSKFDVIICAACLHWFIPHEDNTIQKMKSLLKPGGKLFLSCAFNFDYLPGEKDIQHEVLLEVRNKFKTISPTVIFDDFRFKKDIFLKKFSDFDIIKSHRIEERVSFDTYEDFRDWHLGSGSVLYQQFVQDVRDSAVSEFYEILYSKYVSGAHTISYSTGLFLLEKR
ncbi:class I SAM-dependent methyltransferase (plasmid) [Salmonella enterica subsp. enterica serovar Karamoja]|uniref:Class I SAM-dependent methyltransferase n=1 Tax=Salmonella enterica subsp. enterica serovar Karamoja TaxID=2500153 RepID=A0A3Q9MSI1_SALET|nr:class I SAM-dependent methyltransferase [Salmonella enterica]AZT39608.1 class I SAM-dependent methyltransferase [Salmonella enterica subsp. enterica serovar Karamoja]AZT44309.1 class I SAM-dependent methyltransferase [Salmonella enterica subsp. enterica serovar Karamoja]